MKNLVDAILWFFLGLLIVMCWPILGGTDDDDDDDHDLPAT